MIIVTCNSTQAQVSDLFQNDTTPGLDIKHSSKNEITIGYIGMIPNTINRSNLDIRTHSMYDRTTINYSRQLFSKGDFKIKGILGYGYTKGYGHFNDIFIEIEPKRAWYALVISAGVQLNYFDQSYKHTNGPGVIGVLYHPFQPVEPVYVLKIGSNIRFAKRFIIKPSIDLRRGRATTDDSNRYLLPTFSLYGGIEF
jgi:hypothetical protein